MPEDLPTAKSIKRLTSQERRKLKKQKPDDAE
jgi:hypothetical protein